MPATSPSSAFSPFPSDKAAEIGRGTLRLLDGLGYFGLMEMSLANNRRADLVAIGAAGEIIIVEIKSSVADFQSDAKWPEYMPYCDQFFFAVGPDFPQELIPDEAGLIVADGYGGAVIRDAPLDKLAAARRKAMTLKFGRLAASRLQATQVAGWTSALATPRSTV